MTQFVPRMKQLGIKISKLHTEFILLQEELDDTIEKETQVELFNAKDFWGTVLQLCLNANQRLREGLEAERQGKKLLGEYKKRIKELDDAIGRENVDETAKRLDKDWAQLLWDENRRLKEELEAERLWIKEGTKLVSEYKEKISKLQALLKNTKKYFSNRESLRRLKIKCLHCGYSPCVRKECEFCGHTPCGCGG